MKIAATRIGTIALTALLVLGAGLAGPTVGSAQTSPPPEGTPPAPASTPVPSPQPAAPAEPAQVVNPEEAAEADEPAADEVVVREDDSFEGYPGLGRPTSRNVVFVRNRHDGDLRVRGRIRLVKEHGERAEPLNAAFAYASCTDCQTFAVALEIALIGPGASVVSPQNRARALNYECDRCVTVARALQYAYVVDDPNEVPENVRALMNQLERELRSIGRERGVTAAEAEARVNAVIEQFQALAASLNDQRDETVERTSPGAAPPPAEPVPSPAALAPGQ